MAAVVAERFWESKFFVGKCCMVVHINDVIRLCIGFKAFVDVDDGLGGVFDLGPPPKRCAGWYGADDGHDAVGLGEVAHGDDVVDHLVGRHPIVVVRHIVGASHDDHSLRLEVDDISGEPDQHLCRGLSANASSTEVVAAEKVWMVEGPYFGDGVAHKNHLWVVAARDDTVVVGLIAVEAEPVLGITKYRHSCKNDKNDRFLHGIKFLQIYSFVCRKCVFLHAFLKGNEK